MMYVRFCSGPGRPIWPNRSDIFARPTQGRCSSTVVVMQKYQAYTHPYAYFEASFVLAQSHCTRCFHFSRVLSGIKCLYRSIFISHSGNNEGKAIDSLYRPTIFLFSIVGLQNDGCLNYWITVVNSFPATASR